ncbi:MAG: OmpA family protein [Bacteroidia bacterium]|nr:OmpA family protein [Bacteroidia bacterium]
MALIQGRVYNAKTKVPIQASIVYESLPEGENVGNAFSSPESGNYKVVLPLGRKYALLAEAPGFMSVDENIDLIGRNAYQEIERDLYLVPIEEGATVRLNNIFFEKSRYNLLPDSYPELNRLIKVLKNNPNMIIRLEGHTEAFGKKKDQYELAENRVNSVKRYLVEIGSIDTKRIQLKSYGGSRLLTRELSEEARALNRRVEIKILRK